VTETPRERERGFDRFLTFIDAVVAIAITLLVLPLAEIAGEVGEGSVADLLAEHRGEVFAFVLSFFVIAQLWFAQHHVVNGLVRQDPVVERLLLLWLFTIVVLPFPTALLADAADDAATKVLYIGTLAVSSLLLALVSWRIRRTPDIRDDDTGPEPARIAVLVVVFLVALAISLLWPATSYWPLFLLVLQDPIADGWRRARGSGSATTRVGG
jgi:uncharacterized membrane protein